MISRWGELLITRSCFLVSSCIISRYARNNKITPRGCDNGREVCFHSILRKITPTCRHSLKKTNTTYPEIIHVVANGNQSSPWISMLIMLTRPACPMPLQEFEGRLNKGGPPVLTRMFLPQELNDELAGR